MLTHKRSVCRFLLPSRLPSKSYIATSAYASHLPRHDNSVSTNTPPHTHSLGASSKAPSQFDSSASAGHSGRGRGRARKLEQLPPGFIASLKSAPSPDSIESQLDWFARTFGTHPVAFRTAACALARMGRTSHAVRVLSRIQPANMTAEKGENVLRYLLGRSADTSDAVSSRRLFDMIPPAKRNVLDVLCMVRAHAKTSPAQAAAYVRIMMRSPMPKKGFNSRGALLHALTVAQHCGDFDLGEESWRWAVSRRDFALDAAVYDARTKFLAAVGRFDMMQKAVKEAQKLGIDITPAHGIKARLLAAADQRQDVDECLRLFEELPSQEKHSDPHVLRAMVRVHLQNDRPKEGVRFARMLMEHTTEPLDTASIVVLLKLAAQAADHALGKDLLRLAEGIISVPLAKKRKGNSATKSSGSTSTSTSSGEQRQVSIFRAIVWYHARVGDSASMSKAIEAWQDRHGYIDETWLRGVRLNAALWRGDAQRCVEAFEEICASRDPPLLRHYGAVIQALVQSTDGRQTSDPHGSDDMHDFTVGEHPLSAQVARITEMLLHSGLTPDQHTASIALTAASRTKEFALGERVWKWIVHGGRSQSGPPAGTPDQLAFDPVVCGARLAFLGSGAKFTEAHTLWKECLLRRCDQNASIVGSYLTVLAASGDGRRALELWRSHTSFITVKGASSLLTALAHCSMVSEMQSLWPELSQRITLSIIHYNCLMDGLSRAGRLEECFVQLKKLEKLGGSCRPNEVTYMTLLGAARNAGNVDAARRIFKDMKTRGFHRSAGAYDLLASCEAASGNSAAARKLHDERITSGLRKLPGMSSVVVDGVTYGFVANEMSHVWVRGRKTPLPAKMSRAIEDKLRSTGNTCTHSEKLALAYALLKGETEVVIFKNIRMCSDCHSSTLQMTRGTGVRVRHRDQNRWHDMLDGVCSCKDFW